jgi:hypothetical protein
VRCGPAVAVAAGAGGRSSIVWKSSARFRSHPRDAGLHFAGRDAVVVAQAEPLGVDDVDVLEEGGAAVVDGFEGVLASAVGESCAVARGPEHAVVDVDVEVVEVIVDSTNETVPESEPERNARGSWSPTGNSLVYATARSVALTWGPKSITPAPAGSGRFVSGGSMKIARTCLIHRFGEVSFSLPKS